MGILEFYFCKTRLKNNEIGHDLDGHRSGTGTASSRHEEKNKMSDILLPRFRLMKCQNCDHTPEQVDHSKTTSDVQDVQHLNK